jgi:hypothetical protein
MPREVGADCYGRCAGVVTGHVESLRTCEWGDFVGAYLVGVGGFADDQRGRELMSKWDDAKAVKVGQKIVRAQESFLIAYRVGGRPAEWAFDYLHKNQQLFLDYESEREGENS